MEPTARPTSFVPPLRRASRGCSNGRCRGTLTPWPCGRTAALASAARRNLARGHCRTTDTPQPPHWTASVKASRALSQHLLRLRPSRTARRRIAHFNSATPRSPRDHVMRPRGAVDRALRARRVSMPCRVASRAHGANATPARHRVKRGAKNFCVDPARRRPIACARRCARAPERAGPQRTRQLNFDLKTLQARHREGAFLTRRDRVYALNQAADLLHALGFPV